MLVIYDKGRGPEKNTEKSSILPNLGGGGSARIVKNQTSFFGSKKG